MREARLLRCWLNCLESSNDVIGPFVLPVYICSRLSRLSRCMQPGNAAAFRNKTAFRRSISIRMNTFVVISRLEITEM